MDMLATRREPELAVAVWLWETTRSHQTGGDSRPPSGWTKYCSTVSPDRLNNSSSWLGHLLQTHEGPYLSRGAALTEAPDSSQSMGSANRTPALSCGCKAPCLMHNALMR